jgi:hypothetical protein
MMAISIARAKVLCDVGELALVKASGPREIGAMSAAELRRAETRARKLRDKWRDQSAGQRRKAQAKAGTRDAGANRNSAEKAELFEEVLGRFTAQLGKSEAAGDAPGPMGRKRSTKTARSRTHRAKRAEVRAEIKNTKRELKAGKKRATAAKSAPKKLAEAATPSDVKTRVKKKVAKKAPVAEAFSEAKTPLGRELGAERQPAMAGGDMQRGMDEPPASVKQPKRTGKPFEAGVTALEAGRKAQGLRVTKLQQLNASAAAKKNRMLASGMLRIQKNRSAANKRAQGRRDSR